MKLDYLVVGAGLFGAVFAHEMKRAGKSCLVIDKRNHIGGNIYTEQTNGIHVHKYGPHIFHTNDRKIWEYANRFVSFNHFTYRPRVRFQSHVYSFPINLMTLHQLWGIHTPAEAVQRLEAVRIPTNKDDLRSWILSQVGQEIYETFFEGYTTKQWQKDPSLLPSSIVKRLPIRLTYDDNYFQDCYQGIPINGYTELAANLLEGIPIELEQDYLQDRNIWNDKAKYVVFTGPIDSYFDHCYGRLDYRSLRFEEEHLDGDFQGVAAVNYTESQIPFTRIVEHKHFNFLKLPHTIITREYPSSSGEPYYPINDTKNQNLYERYKALAKLLPQVIFGGRLASYRYYDMNQIIAQALVIARSRINN